MNEMVKLFAKCLATLTYQLNKDLEFSTEAIC